jgi:hypothetical protein
MANIARVNVTTRHLMPTRLNIRLKRTILMAMQDFTKVLALTLVQNLTETLLMLGDVTTCGVWLYPLTRPWNNAL